MILELAINEADVHPRMSEMKLCQVQDLAMQEVECIIESMMVKREHAIRTNKDSSASHKRCVS